MFLPGCGVAPCDGQPLFAACTYAVGNGRPARLMKVGANMPVLCERIGYASYVLGVAIGQLSQLLREATPYWREIPGSDEVLDGYYPGEVHCFESAVVSLDGALIRFASVSSQSDQWLDLARGLVAEAKEAWRQYQKLPPEQFIQLDPNLVRVRVKDLESLVLGVIRQCSNQRG